MFVETLQAAFNALFSDIPTLIGHFGYLCNAMGFILRDILWLRCFAVVGSILIIIYNVFIAEHPGWINVFWHSIFCAINSMRIYNLISEIMGVRFSTDERLAYEMVFESFSPVDFYKFVRKGKLKTLKKGTVLTEQNRAIHSMYLLFDGKAEVVKDGTPITDLVQYTFIGEMAYTTRAPASATVTLTQDSKVFVWDFDDIRELLRNHTTMRIAFQTSVGTDMAKKLSGTTRNPIMPGDA